MVAGVEDAVILAQQLLHVVPGDLAEFVVDVRNLTVPVGGRDYGGLVQGRLKIRHPPERGAQRLLGLLAGGDVARDLGEAPEVASLVPQGRYDDLGEEARAVLADPQTLLLEAALGGRHA